MKKIRATNSTSSTNKNAQEKDEGLDKWYIFVEEKISIRIGTVHLPEKKDGGLTNGTSANKEILI